MFLRWLLGQLACKQHTRFFCPLVFLHNLTLKLYISQPMLAWLWTCPTCTWPPCSSINTTSSLEQWPAGCRYTHPHIFLVKVGLLKLLHVVGGLLRAQINHCKVFPTWSTNRVFTVLDMVWPYIFIILCFLSWTKQLGNMLWTERWAAMWVHQ